MIDAKIVSADIYQRERKLQKSVDESRHSNVLTNVCVGPVRFNFEQCFFSRISAWIAAGAIASHWQLNFVQNILFLSALFSSCNYPGVNYYSKKYMEMVITGR